jgi:peptidoglycan/LPS O-acetylase OafA/YrhL
MDLVTFGIIIIVVAFAVFVGFKRLSSTRRGEPAEDELSKKVMQKTSSLSYYISLYLWLAIMYFSDRFKYETHTVIGAGILGMAITFAICWIVINFRGVRNE